jgi:hypothetical protein
LDYNFVGLKISFCLTQLHFVGLNCTLSYWKCILLDYITFCRTKLHFVWQGKNSNFFGLKRISSWTNIGNSDIFRGFSFHKVQFYCKINFCQMSCIVFKFNWILENNAFFGDFSFKKYLCFRNSDIFRGFSFDKGLIPQKFKHFWGDLTKCNLVRQNEFLVRQNAI